MAHILLKDLKIYQKELVIRNKSKFNLLEDLNLSLNAFIKSKNSDMQKIPEVDRKSELDKEKPKGYLVVDNWDDAVPEGVREYCHKNLKRELGVDRLYPVQPRYWTVWIYSRGMD